MYPKLLRAGTIIQVGTNNPNSMRSALGLEFILKEDAEIDSAGESRYVDGDVIKNPNGWPFNEIVHGIELEYDRIVGNVGSNKFYKNSLENIND